MTQPRLYHRERQPAELLVRRAHVVDPRTGIDEPHDILIRDGAIAELVAPGSLAAPEDGELFDAAGRHAFPAGVLGRALQYQRLCGGVIALHEEDPALSGDGVMHEGAISARLGLAGIPSVSESTMVARDGALAGYERARVHFQHLSARESIEALEQAKRAGARVSGEVTPHHLTLTD